MTPTEYAEFVTQVRDMVHVNDLEQLMRPRIPAQRSPVDLVASWLEQGYTPVERGRMLVAVAS